MTVFAKTDMPTGLEEDASRGTTMDVVAVGDVEAEGDGATVMTDIRVDIRSLQACALRSMLGH